MLGDNLSAEQAAQWGMIWQVVDDAELKDTSVSHGAPFCYAADLWAGVKSAAAFRNQYAGSAA
jgi:enoyl-CoA hydratase/carnithine racemase